MPDDEKNDWENAQEAWDARRRVVGAIPALPPQPSNSNLPDSMPVVGPTGNKLDDLEDGLRAIQSLTQNLPSRAEAERWDEYARRQMVRLLHGRMAAERETSQDRREDIAAAFVQGARPAEKAVSNPNPETASPMHAKDRAFYVLILWAGSIAGALVVGCFIAWGSGQMPWQWAVPGIAIGAVAMAAATLYALEKKLPKPRWRPGPIMIGVAVLTWALVGWQAWLAFHPPIQSYTHMQLGQSGPEYLKNIVFGIDERIADKPSMLGATSALTVDRLRVFVDYTLYKNGWMTNKIRVKIGEIKEPVAGQNISLPFIYAVVRPSVQNLFWGDPNLNQYIYPPDLIDLIPIVPYRARLAIIGPSGQEQHYYFEMFRFENDQVRRFAILHEQPRDWMDEWEKEDK